MNEQEMITKKIEKREKVDIFLAYLLIIILLGGIAFVVYLKFFNKSSTTDPKEHLSNYISLESIATGLSSSSLAEELKITSSASNNIITITYQKENNEKKLEIPLINNELEVTITEEDREDITNIYKEIAKTICKYYNTGKEDACDVVINNLSSTDTDGIRFVSNENSNVVYINIMKGVDVSSYTNTTKSLNLENISKENTSNILIDNITVSNANSEVIIEYNVSYKNETEKKDFKLGISLYDENDTLLLEKTKEYKKEDITSILEDAEVFPLNETLKLDAIKKYSINITE